MTPSDEKLMLTMMQDQINLLIEIRELLKAREEPRFVFNDRGHLVVKVASMPGQP
jgi:hypothetical protein